METILSAPGVLTCKCGRPVLFTNETRCEDCYADDQQKYDGKSKRADYISASELREFRQSILQARQ